MGLFRRDPKYDRPIVNPLTDWLYEIWGGVELRQKKRWRRRREFNRMMRWWYDEHHPMRGVRALSIIALLFTIVALSVSGRIVAGRICVLHVGCASTADGAVEATGSTEPRVLTP